MNGWVKIYRRLLDWQWFKDSKMVHLFIYLLLSASTEEKVWHNVTVQRGQLLTTVAELSDILQISAKSIRTCLERLANSEEIVKETTNRFTLITICKYESYQEKSADAQPVQPASGPKAVSRPKESAPLPPTGSPAADSGIRYYYSPKGASEEERQKQQYIYILFLKGSADPRTEMENFISWNMSPKRIADWEACPEWARYEACEKRWRIRGPKLKGYDEKAGRLLTRMVRTLTEHFDGIVRGMYSTEAYPLSIDGDTARLRCTRKVREAMEGFEGADDIYRMLSRNGIHNLRYIER